MRLAHPHTVLPLVIEHAGSINKEGVKFIRVCQDAPGNPHNAGASGLASRAQLHAQCNQPEWALE